MVHFPWNCPFNKSFGFHTSTAEVRVLPRVIYDEMSTVQTHPMRIQIIQVPYDSGHKNHRMGLGPGHIVRHLKSEHFPLPEVGEVEVHDGFALEIGTRSEEHTSELQSLRHLV